MQLEEMSDDAFHVLQNKEVEKWTGGRQNNAKQEESRPQELQKSRIVCLFNMKMIFPLRSTSVCTKALLENGK